MTALATIWSLSGTRFENRDGTCYDAAMLPALTARHVALLALLYPAGCAGAPPPPSSAAAVAIRVGVRRRGGGDGDDRHYGVDDRQCIAVAGTVAVAVAVAVVRG